MMIGELIVYALIGWLVFLAVAVFWIEFLERRRDKQKGEPTSKRMF
jgi:heme/copper-type cytochrome/quinol oxidase subunit 2